MIAADTEAIVTALAALRAGMIYLSQSAAPEETVRRPIGGPPAGEYSDLTWSYQSGQRVTSRADGRTGQL